LSGLTLKPHIAEVDSKGHCANQENSQPKEHKHHYLARLPVPASLDIIKGIRSHGFTIHALNS